MKPGRHTPLESLEPRRVCIVKPSSLGDVVHALPVLAALRERWPDARFSWIVNRGLRGLLDGHPHLDEVIPFDRAAFRPSFSGARAFASFLADLRRRRFDLAIDLQGLFRSGLLAAATRAPVRVGLADSREGARFFHTHVVPLPDHDPNADAPLHAVDRMMRVARAFAASRPEDPPRFVTAIRDADRRWAEAILRDVPHPRVVFNPGARWVTKRWPPEHFAELARRAARERGAGLIVVGAPEDRPLADRFLAAIGADGPPVLDLVARTDLKQLAAVAEAADVFVSNDTGPLHLAAAAGIDVLGVYTCTDPRRTGPYGPNAHTVVTSVWCKCSLRKTCERMDCMTELQPRRVAPLLDRLLDDAAARRACLPPRVAPGPESAPAPSPASAPQSPVQT